MAWLIAVVGVLLALLYEANSGAASSDTGAAVPLFLPDSSSAGSSGASSGLNIPQPANVSSGGDMTAIEKFVLGIWKTEGMGADDRSVRNNNPGNLKFAGQPGAVPDGTADNFAVFSSFNLGFSAAVRQVQLDLTRNPNWTVLQEMRKWLGMDPNAGINVTDQGNALTKAQTVAASVGAKPTDTLSSVLG